MSLWWRIWAGGELAGSRAELLSAMSNLLNNAIRYTPAGGSIELKWQRLPDARVEFSVRDSGPGIAPEHIPRLTERFYRVDSSRSRETGGYGSGPGDCQACGPASRRRAAHRKPARPGLAVFDCLPGRAGAADSGRAALSLQALRAAFHSRPEKHCATNPMAVVLAAQNGVAEWVAPCGPHPS